MADHSFLCWLVRIHEAGSSMRLHWLLWISWRLRLPEVNLSYLCAIITHSPKNKIFLFLFLSACNLGLPNNLPIHYIVVQSLNIFCYQTSRKFCVIEQQWTVPTTQLESHHKTVWIKAIDEMMSAAADQCIRLQVHMACLCTLCAKCWEHRRV